MTKRPRHDLKRLHISGQDIQWVNVTKYLGHYIRSDLRESDEIIHKRSDFIGRVNYVLASFSKADASVKREIFDKQCCHLYGCETWQLNDCDITKFYKTWNHGARRVFDLPRCTHTRFLEYFVGHQYVQDQIYKRS